MPTFSPTLEKTLHQALSSASERHHEFATPEHLLLALIDDDDAAQVMQACRVDLEELRKTVIGFVDSELDNLVTGSNEDSKPTSSFQRIVQRAVIHVTSSGREEVTGANVLVAIFAERESQAAEFLREQEMTRYDAVNYISHGIAKNQEFQLKEQDDESDLFSEYELRFPEPESRRAPRQIIWPETPAPPSPFIFLSYASADRARVRNIHSMLSAAGLPIWWDQDIKPGDQWRDKIDIQLRSATAVLTIWTTNSVKSAAVREEAYRAQSDRRLVHLRLDASELPYGFAETQCVEMADWDGTPSNPKFISLIEALRIKLVPPSRAEMARRLTESSPISAVVRDGKLAQIDRPEYVLPQVQDKAELDRRLTALCQLIEAVLRMVDDRDHFQAHPCAAHTLGSILSAASVALPTWYSLEDSAELLHACMDSSNAECAWNGALYTGARKILARVEEIRNLLEPRQLTPEQPEGRPSPPVAAIPQEEVDGVLVLANEAETAFKTEEAHAVVGPDLQASAIRAVEQIRDADMLPNSEERLSRLRAGMTKLTYVVGTVAIAIAGGVTTSLLTAPEAATTLSLQLQSIFDRLLGFFY